MIGQVRNQQEAICRMTQSDYRSSATYFATYDRPFERVPFECSLNPMVLLLESLTVLSGRPAQEGFAQYGPEVYRNARPGSVLVDFGDRHKRFSTDVRDGVINAELVVSKAGDLHQLVSDSICFSSVQECLARKHGLKVGRFFHVCEDVSELPKPGYAGEPYSNSDVVAYPICGPTMMQHLGMFLDEGMVLGVRDTFLGHVAHPTVESLRCLFSKVDEKMELAWQEIGKGDPQADWVTATMAHLTWLKRTGKA